MKILYSIILCLCLATLHAIEGIYDVTGYDPYNNMAYRMTCKIVKVDDMVYTGHWIREDKKESYKGTGLRVGNQISFALVSKDPAENIKFIGLQNYEIQGDTLTGSWIFYNQDRIGLEHMVKRK